ncbi:MAG: hypothetical protein U9P81_06355 [Euryarchaeota archaeon]|nr:hypothetical protein [Euryarchaeota archaeon]
MNSNRKTAIVEGVLYIAAMVAGILSVVSLGSLLDGPDKKMEGNSNERARKLCYEKFLMLKEKTY